MIIGVDILIVVVMHFFTSDELKCKLLNYFMYLLTNVKQKQSTASTVAVEKRSHPGLAIARS